MVPGGSGSWCGLSQMAHLHTAGTRAGGLETTLPFVCVHMHMPGMYTHVCIHHTHVHTWHTHTPMHVYTAHMCTPDTWVHTCVCAHSTCKCTRMHTWHTQVHTRAHTPIVSPPMKTKSLLQQELTFSKITVRGFLPPDAEPRSPPCPRRPGAEGAHGSVAAGNTWPGWRGREPRGRAGASGSGGSLGVRREPRGQAGALGSGGSLRVGWQPPAARAPVRGASLAERPSGSMTEAHCHLR